LPKFHLDVFLPLLLSVIKWSRTPFDNCLIIHRIWESTTLLLLWIEIYGAYSLLCL
jgi:hypothetical protein